MDKFMARLHLMRRESPPSTAALNGILIAEEQQTSSNENEEYCRLYRQKQMENVPLAEFIELKNSSQENEPPLENRAPESAKNASSSSAPNKFASLFHICAKSQINEENGNDQKENVEIKEKEIELNLLNRRCEMQSCSMDKFVSIVVEEEVERTELSDPNLIAESEAPPAANNKFTAKIFLKPTISTPKKSTSKKRRKDKKAAKDGKKQKKAKGGATASTSAESSSTSSSSTDEETEAVHILVNDDHRKQPRLDPRQELNEQQNAGSQPYTLVVDPPHAHTTVETWHEEQIGPEQVTTEVDKEGNVIKRTVRTEQIRHTVQTQSYQQVPVNDDENMSPPITAQSKKSPPAPPPRSSVLYENGHNNSNSQQSNGGQNNVMDGGDGELVSTKVVTTGNRTVETLTYKTEKEGVVETRVEHRITIHSNEAIDHDAELSRAILEATSMNPELKVEKVEVDRGGLKK